MKDTATIKLDILKQLHQKGKSRIPKIDTEQNWHSLKRDLSAKAQKYNDSARAFTFIASFCLIVMGVICVAAIWGYTLTPDLKSGGLFVFLTVCNIASAYVHRLRLLKLRHQIALIDLLVSMEKNESH